jgi:hypothetical protein
LREPEYQSEYERFHEDGVMFTVTYRADKPDDISRWIWTDPPQCLEHATEMVPIDQMVSGDSQRDITPENWYGWNGHRFGGWKCEGCDRAVSGSTDKRLEIEAKSRAMKRIKPQVFVG